MTDSTEINYIKHIYTKSKMLPICNHLGTLNNRSKVKTQNKIAWYVRDNRDGKAALQYSKMPYNPVKR